LFIDEFNTNKKYIIKKKRILKLKRFGILLNKFKRSDYNKKKIVRQLLKYKIGKYKYLENKLSKRSIKFNPLIVEFKKKVNKIKALFFQKILNLKSVIQYYKKSVGFLYKARKLFLRKVNAYVKLLTLAIVCNTIIYFYTKKNRNILLKNISFNRG